MERLFCRVMLTYVVSAAGIFAQTPADGKDWVELFNGKNLDGWVVKFAGHELGDNYADTFRCFPSGWVYSGVPNRECWGWGALILPYLDQAPLHNQLGVGAVIGDAVWDSQGHFEVRVGPMGYQGFRNFLPDGKAARKLCDLIRIFAGPAMGFRMRLVLRGEELPSSRLGDDSMAPRLGWDLWLDPADRFQEADDAVFGEAA